jgi:glycosyltransferase involved in cell wall biosynthesis
MKILYFHQHFTTPSGAGGIRSYQMAKKLVATGHKVTMVCGSNVVAKTGLTEPFQGGKRRGMVDGIDVIQFDLSYSNADGFIRRTWLFLLFALRSIRVAIAEHCDIVFATSTPLTAAIPGILARWFRGRKFVFEVRDLWPELPRAMGVIKNPIVLSLMSALEWAAYKSAHRCIGLSPGIVKGIVSRGIAANKVVMIPNGCDLEIFASQSIEPWRPESVAATDLMAIFTGTHGTANGLDAVLDAAAILNARGQKEIKLVLIGEGKLKPHLIKRAQDDGLSNVIFCDSVDKSKLAGLMKSADVGMQCLANIPAFYYGTSPNKFFDYLAAGLPVITNYPGWIAEKIVHHKCGFAVMPDNAEDFADKLQYANSNRDVLVTMGRNARALAKLEFNREDLAFQWVQWVTGIEQK